MNKIRMLLSILLIAAISNKVDAQCDAPTAGIATNILDVSADLGWTSSESLWDVELGLYGFPQTGTPTDLGVTNTFSAAGLIPSTTYQFYVRANCGSSASSTWAGPFKFTTAAACADPTAGIATNILDVSADLGWTSTASTWYIELGAGGFTQTGIPTDTSVASTFSAAGLIPSTTYQFYVRADCGGGLALSGWAGPFSFTTVAAIACAAPTSGIATNILDVSADLGWTSTASTWHIELGAGSFTQTGTPTDTSVASTFSAAGLIPSTAYQFYVRADCSTASNGFSTWSGPFKFTTAAAIACAAPMAGVATNVLPTSADLGWTSTASTWDVELNTVGFSPTGTPTNTGVTNTFNVTGLTALTAYDFYVRADCGSDGLSIWAGPFNFTTDIGIGINDLTLNVASLYPNPTSNVVNVGVENFSSSVSYSLLSIDGRIVKDEQKVTSNNFKVDLTTESNGVYFLKISDSKVVKTYKLIKFQNH